MPINQKYIEQLNLHNSILLNQKKRLRLFNYARGLSFAASIALPIAYSQPAFYILGGVVFLIFLILIKQTANLNGKINETLAFIEINETELLALQHKTKGFYPGNEFINGNHSYSYDMDIFGQSSLFQHINRTISLSGKLELTKLFKSTNASETEILERQESVSELKSKFNFRQKFRMTGMALASAKYFTKDYTETSDKLKKDFFDWTHSPSRLSKNPLWKIAAIALPALSAALLILAIIHILPYIYFVLVGLIQLTLVGSQIKYINAQHVLLGEKNKSLQVYTKLIQQIENEDFKAKLVSDLQNKLKQDKKTASDRLVQFGKLLTSLDFRFNIVVAFLLNMTLLWDIRIVMRLERFKADLSKHIEIYFESVGKVDALISLAYFADNNPEFVFPKITTDKFSFELKQGGHPLIFPENRVDNDFEIKEFRQMGIITGSNMAGKSTFLRTVGVNMVLASAGSVVCAEKMTYSPIKLFTSIRNQDSLSENASYFYAELIRLKSIIGTLNSGEKLFIIIDEMLRGTNSKDKHEGSRALIEQLITREMAGLVATHDVQLGDLEKIHPGRVFNFRFESDIIDEKLEFDYKIKPGISQKLNAGFLMKKYGIIQ